MRMQANGSRSRRRTLFLAQFGILLAIEAVFCFTPLGSLPALGPIVATLAMIPVVITGILLGVKAGTLMGFFAGTFSFIVMTFMPPNPMTAFIFTPFYQLGEYSGNAGSLLICFVPRILTGTVAGLVYALLRKRFSERSVAAFSIAAALGSLTNTLGVMGGIWLFFSEQCVTLTGQAILVYIGWTILSSGLPEAAISAIAAAAICKPALGLFRKN